MPNLTFDFTGRTVIVTGAGQGIGKEIGALFAAHGMVNCGRPVAM